MKFAKYLLLLTASLFSSLYASEGQKEEKNVSPEIEYAEEEVVDDVLVFDDVYGDEEESAEIEE